MSACRMGKLAGYAEAQARVLPEPFKPVSGRLYPGLPPVVPEYLAKQVLAAWLPDARETWRRPRKTPPPRPTGLAIRSC